MRPQIDGSWEKCTTSYCLSSRSEFGDLFISFEVGYSPRRELFFCGRKVAVLWVVTTSTCRPPPAYWAGMEGLGVAAQQHQCCVAWSSVRKPVWEPPATQLVCRQDDVVLLGIESAVWILWLCSLELWESLLHISSSPKPWQGAESFLCLGFSDLCVALSKSSVQLELMDVCSQNKKNYISHSLKWN